MADTASIHRYEVPVDDEWHALQLSGAVLHVAARRPDVVELWALNSGGIRLDRKFRVFGTGQPLPEERLSHMGTALAADGRPVWHLMERNFATAVVLDGTR
jgi:hypothetical protein